MLDALLPFLSTPDEIVRPQAAARSRAVATIVLMGNARPASMLKPLLASDRVRRVTGAAFAPLLVLFAAWLAITTHRSW